MAEAERVARSMTGENAAPAEMPDELVRKVIEIVESAVNSAIPEPWEVSARASAAILALFAPILAEKERQLVSFRQYVAMHRDRALAAEAALAEAEERCAKWADKVAAAIRAEGSG